MIAYLVSLKEPLRYKITEYIYMITTNHKEDRWLVIILKMFLWMTYDLHAAFLRTRGALGVLIIDVVIEIRLQFKS